MTDSWWLKVKRAQHHMVEIKRYARSYADSHPYGVVPVRRQPKGHPDTWFYSLQITQQPDPMIAVILGDFVHNLRSALDHIIVASVPPQQRKSASMPIVMKDIWEKDASGKLLVSNREARGKYRIATAGLDRRAKAIIRGIQPYHMGLDDADRHSLGIISRLENADKHRQLITVGSGVERAVFDTFVRGQLVKRSSPTKHGNFVYDGAQQSVIFPDGRPPHSEVQVKCQSTAVITIKITGIRGNEPPSDFRLYTTMLGAIGDVRLFLRRMEPFVTRR